MRAGTPICVQICLKAARFAQKSACRPSPALLPPLLLLHAACHLLQVQQAYCEASKPHLSGFCVYLSEGIQICAKFGGCSSPTLPPLLALPPAAYRLLQALQAYSEAIRPHFSGFCANWSESVQICAQFGGRPSPTLPLPLAPPPAAYHLLQVHQTAPLHVSAQICPKAVKFAQKSVAAFHRGGHRPSTCRCLLPLAVFCRHGKLQEVCQRR